MINKDTGEPFKGRDFHVGSVAKLPSVSLEVCRGYSAQRSAPKAAFFFSSAG